MKDYCNAMQTRTLATRLLHLMEATSRSRFTDNGGDPRNTADGWYWCAVRVLYPLRTR